MNGRQVAGLRARGVVQLEKQVQEGVGVGRHEHRRVADRLHQAHRRLHQVRDQLSVALGQRAQLVRRHALAQAGEAGEVRERHRGVHGAREAAALALAGPHRHLAHHGAQVRAQGVAEARLQERHQLSALLAVAGRQVVLGVARAQERRAERGGQGGRQVGHALAQHARHLEDALVRDARLPDHVHVHGRLHVRGVVGAVVRRPARAPERAVHPLEEVEVEPRSLGHLLRGEALVAVRQGPLHGQQDELVLGHSAPQLLLRHAGRAQLREQRLARLALLLGGHALEQVTRVGVVGHGAHVHTSRPRHGASGSPRRFET